MMSMPSESFKMHKHTKTNVDFQSLFTFRLSMAHQGVIVGFHPMRSEPVKLQNWITGLF